MAAAFTSIGKVSNLAIIFSFTPFNIFILNLFSAIQRVPIRSNDLMFLC